jgi:predicted small metal-binding protein
LTADFLRRHHRWPPTLVAISRKDIWMKQIACGDIVPGCNFTAEADTEEKLLDKVAAHAKTAHGLDVTPELVDQVKSKIKST